MSEEGFILTQGVDADITGVRSAYTATEGGYRAVMSAEKLLPAAKELVGLLDEPVFFFLELPESDDEEDGEYDVYYLDNCTLPVAQAILERYGELLTQDGITRFGFGSHTTEEEVYFTDYQMTDIYCPGNTAAAKVLEKAGLERTDSLVTLWDNISEDAPGICMRVELNGETTADIVENLRGEGMYKADNS